MGVIYTHFSFINVSSNKHHLLYWFTTTEQQYSPKNDEIFSLMVE